MDIIFDGTFSKTRTMADLLKAVMGAAHVSFGVLRISSADGRLSGKLLIGDNSEISGAALADGSIRGFAAARQLLSVAEGNFAFLDAGLKRPDLFGPELCLSLQRTISQLPQLPAEPSLLFDEQGLLDKIFGDAPPLPAKAPPGSRLSDLQPVQPPVAGLSDTDCGLRSVWSFMQPLLDTGPLKSLDLQDTSSKRGSLKNLRYQPFDDSRRGPWYAQLWREALLSRQAITWAGFVVVALAVVTSFSTFTGKPNQNHFPKHNNSLTIQKGITPATHL